MLHFVTCTYRIYSSIVERKFSRNQYPDDGALFYITPLAAGPSVDGDVFPKAPSPSARTGLRRQK